MIWSYRRRGLYVMAQWCTVYLDSQVPTSTPACSSTVSSAPRSSSPCGGACPPVSWPETPVIVTTVSAPVIVRWSTAMDLTLVSSPESSSWSSQLVNKKLIFWTSFKNYFSVSLILTFVLSSSSNESPYDLSSLVTSSSSILIYSLALAATLIGTCQIRYNRSVAELFVVL